jgi:hypothetical protein
LSPLGSAGKSVTLIPLDDPREQVLLALREAHANITTKPAELFSTQFHRVDELIMAVGRLFREQEYVSVTCKEDMVKVIKGKTSELSRTRRAPFTVG